MRSTLRRSEIRTSQSKRQARAQISERHHQRHGIERRDGHAECQIEDLGIVGDGVDQHTAHANDCGRLQYAQTRIAKQRAAERRAVTGLRRSGARSVSISSITMAELLYGARLREDNPSVMAAVRAFLTRISVHAWDEGAAEAHARFVSMPSALGGVQEHLTS